MNKTDKIIIAFYIFLAVSYTSAIIYMDSSFSDVKLRNEGKKAIDEIELIKTVPIDKIKLFDTMIDIQNYPIILPKNVISVKILNQSDNVIFAEEELMEKYVKTKLIVKHTIHRYDNYTLEVMNGDAQGTIITQTFDGTDSETKFTTKTVLHLKGILAPFVYFPKYVLVDELNNAILEFVDYAKGFDDENKKIVDDLYREILRRPADDVGLEYYGPLLENGKMTRDDVKASLLKSDEYKSLLHPSERKSDNELTQETRKTIDDLYREILLRPVDKEGLEYFGSMMENGRMTRNDVKTSLLNSEEYKNLLQPSQRKTIDELKDETKKTVDDLYREVLRRPADDVGLEYYGPLLENGKMTRDDVKASLLKSDEYKSMSNTNETKTTG